MNNVLIAADSFMKRIIDDAEQLAVFGTTTVLIEGETGTGKEVLARHIHDNSPRRDGPFVVLDCATIPDTLLESEMFGHEKGAYTGATSAHCGIIEQADGGTLFLDEIANLERKPQSILLRFIEEHEVHRLGNGVPIKVDVRVLAATNQNLVSLININAFRSDLYHRFMVANIWLPPLRERPKDIIPLLDHYLKHWSEFHNVPAPIIYENAHSELERYEWPGNVRELRNAAERFVIQASDGVLDEEMVHAFILGPELQKILSNASKYGGMLKDRRFVCQFLRTWENTQGHVTNTAKHLGISKGSVSRYSRALGLSHSCKETVSIS